MQVISTLWRPVQTIFILSRCPRPLDQTIALPGKTALVPRPRTTYRCIQALRRPLGLVIDTRPSTARLGHPCAHPRKSYLIGPSASLALGCTGSVRCLARFSRVVLVVTCTRYTRHTTQDTRHKTQDTRHKTQDKAIRYKTRDTERNRDVPEVSGLQFGQGARFRGLDLCLAPWPGQPPWNYRAQAR